MEPIDATTDDDTADSALHLSSLQYYDDLRGEMEDDLVREDGTLVDVVGATDASSNSDNTEDEAFAFVHFVSLLAFTDPSGRPFSVGYEAGMAIALALQHLNAGDGSLLKPVQGLNETCNLRFTTEFLNTGLDGTTALNQVVALTDSTYEGRKPSGFLGAVASSVSSPSAIVSSLRGYPQISGSSTSNDLDNRGKYPLFSRTIPSDDGITESIILYLTRELGCTHLAVVNVNDSYGNGYANGLRQAAVKHAPDLNLIQIPVSSDGNLESLSQAITTLKDSGFLFVMAILIDSDQYTNVLDEAVRSPMAKALQGSGRFQVSATIGEKFEKFTNEIKKLKNPRDYAYLGEILPNFTDSPFANDVSFLDPVAFSFTPLFYEATILLGLAAAQTPYTYNDGTTNIPNWVELPDIDQNYISPGVRAVALVLFTVAFLTAAGFVGWTWYRRDCRVVKASQPFLYVIRN
ncbi:MAG: hypothetical protein SGILL_003267, partial [Bacillariaceae sp.]